MPESEYELKKALIMRLTRIFSILEYFHHYSEITVGGGVQLKVICDLQVNQEEEKEKKIEE